MVSFAQYGPSLPLERPSKYYNYYLQRMFYVLCFSESVSPGNRTAVETNAIGIHPQPCSECQRSYEITFTLSHAVNAKDPMKLH